MPRFPDAIGYLLEMRDAVNEAWFHALCDMAIASTGGQPQPAQYEALWDLFHGTAPYTPAAAAVPPARATPATPPTAFIEQLSNFGAFKKLVPGLSIRFDRQLTVIFGKNGSGKSSLCQALKVLANPDRPPDPLHNVRAAFPGTPTFAFKFAAQTTATTWTPASGFGGLAHSIKYFDSTVALKHSTSTLQPQAVVEVTAFRLEVFEYARQLLSGFQTWATSRVTNEAARLQTDIDTTKQSLAQFVNLNAAPFDQFAAVSSDVCARYLDALAEFDATKTARLAECTRLLGQYTTASTEEGLRALRAQHALLEQLATQVSSLSEWGASVRLADLQAAEIQAAQKRAASTELARQAFPQGVNTQQHQNLIREYSENWDELCNEIAPLLAGPGEPSAHDKERAAGLMRRLVERLTNKHVFNEQRHQYKPKSLQVSEFQQFTKIVPLTVTEADTLRDIFANLSPPEHDDPRNFYTTRSRTQFTTWLGQIQSIKAALEARRP